MNGAQDLKTASSTEAGNDGMLKWLTAAAAVLLLTVVSLWIRAHQPPPPPPGLRAGEPATMRALSDLDGRPVELFDGQHGTVLCFFTLTCPGCVEEGEAWRDLTALGRQRNVRVFAVTANASPEEIRRFAKANAVEDLPILYDPAGKLFERFRVEGVPQYLLFDRQGRMVYRSVGDSAPQGFTPHQRAQEILSMLPAKGAAGEAR